jgi:hypothetical protein
MLPALRRLDLHKTAVGDAGVAELKSLAKLEYLNLYGTKVGDAALKSVGELPALAKLYLWQTAVSEAAVAEFKKAHPKVAVNVGAPPPPEPPKTCCEKAAAEKKACEHPCCKAAAEKGRTCFKCKPREGGDLLREGRGGRQGVRAPLLRRGAQGRRPLREVQPEEAVVAGAALEPEDADGAGHLGGSSCRIRSSVSLPVFSRHHFSRRARASSTLPVLIR